jgi:hypothetical protein
MKIIKIYQLIFLCAEYSAIKITLDRVYFQTTSSIYWTVVWSHGRDDRHRNQQTYKELV